MAKPEFDTVSEAKSHLRENFEKGTECPCCGQFVKMYKRKLNAGMSSSLILMYRITLLDEPEDGWLHMQKEFANRGINSNAADYSSLKWWGLIEPNDENDDPKKKTSGYWRITDKGRRFVRNQLKVVSRVYLFNNKLVGRSDDYINIKESLGDKFDYEELMSQ